MNEALVPDEPGADWPTGPSQWPCAPGRGRRHYVRGDYSDGRLAWRCIHCALRYRFGEGLLT